MTPEQEKKWREEFQNHFNKYFNYYSAKNGVYIVDVYLNAREYAENEHADIYADQQEVYEEAQFERDKIFSEQLKERDQQIERLKSQQKEYHLDMYKTAQFQNDLNRQLKERDQEIERLKNRVKELGFNNDYVEEIENKNWELNELIKELMSYSDHHKDCILFLELPKKNNCDCGHDDIYQKAFMLIGGK